MAQPHQALELIRSLVANLTSSVLIPSKVRVWALRLAGVEIGSARIMPGGTYGGALSRVQLGRQVFINYGVSMFGAGGIRIGDNVSIGPRSVIMTGTHEIGTSDRRAKIPSYFVPVSIGDGSWIGANVTIQGGVTIGRGAIVANGAVVVSDCASNGLYGGVPAKLIRTLPAAGD